MKLAANMLFTIMFCTILYTSHALYSEGFEEEPGNGDDPSEPHYKHQGGDGHTYDLPRHSDQTPGQPSPQEGLQTLVLDLNAENIVSTLDRFASSYPNREAFSNLNVFENITRDNQPTTLFDVLQEKAAQIAEQNPTMRANIEAKNQNFLDALLVRGVGDFTGEGFMGFTEKQVATILKAKGNINYQDPTTGETLLMKAAEAGNTKLMLVLMRDMDLDPTIKDTSGKTALDYLKTSTAETFKQQFKKYVRDYGTTTGFFATIGRFFKKLFGLETSVPPALELQQDHIQTALDNLHTAIGGSVSTGQYNPSELVSAARDIADDIARYETLLEKTYTNPKKIGGENTLKFLKNSIITELWTTITLGYHSIENLSSHTGLKTFAENFQNTAQNLMLLWQELLHKPVSAVANLPKKFTNISTQYDQLTEAFNNSEDLDNITQQDITAKLDMMGGIVDHIKTLLPPQSA